MDPLSDGDNGALGSVFDTITGTVNSMERFGQTVGEATTFTMAEAMIWAVIVFMFITLFVRLAKPWNDGAAERWRQTGRIRGGAVGAPDDWRDARIRTLEAQLADVMQQVRDLTGANAPERETANVD